MLKRIMMGIFIILGALIVFSIITDSTEVKEVDNYISIDQTLEGFKSFRELSDRRVEYNTKLARQNLFNLSVKAIINIAGVKDLFTNEKFALLGVQGVMLRDMEVKGMLHKNQEEMVMNSSNQKAKDAYKKVRDALKDTHYPNIPIVLQSSMFQVPEFPKLSIRGYGTNYFCTFYVGPYIMYIVKGVEMNAFEFMYLDWVIHKRADFFGPDAFISTAKDNSLELVEGIEMKTTKGSVGMYSKEKVREFLLSGNSAIVCYTSTRGFADSRHWLAIGDYIESTDEFIIYSGTMHWHPIRVKWEVLKSIDGVVAVISNDSAKIQILE